ncbi:polysaccharide deacetylase family protein [Kitasatospora sp. NPDC056327]|uniref:polysaccharide deacetylase family protein n=1 Tax=Kitasatospora sp. NPDC056327 TaxID=3345785 RepID=UPI0035D57A07
MTGSAVPAGSAAAVPVLRYHSVCDDPPDWIAPYTVTPRLFARQLDRLAAAGREVVPLRRLLAAQRGGPPPAGPCAVLTFDDGFADFFETVVPVLAERELPATLFVTTGAVTVPGRAPAGGPLPPAAMLDWRRIAALEGYGVEVGAHSHTHPRLDGLPARRLAAEVEGSKRRLEEVLDRPVTSFAYPYGRCGPQVRRRVREAGFTAGCAARDAFSSPADDPYRLARLTVTATTGPERFEAWAHGRGAPVAPFDGVRGAGRRVRALLGGSAG